MMEKKTEIRKILAVGKRDAFYEDREELIGKFCKVVYIYHNIGGFYSGIVALLGKHTFYFSEKHFYMVKLSKQRYNEKGEKI